VELRETSKLQMVYKMLVDLDDYCRVQFSFCISLIEPRLTFLHRVGKENFFREQALHKMLPFLAQLWAYIES